MMTNAIFTFLSLDIDEYPAIVKDKYETAMGSSGMSAVNNIIDLYKNISFRSNTNSFGINIQLKESESNSLATILGNADDNYKNLMSL